MKNTIIRMLSSALLLMLLLSVAACKKDGQDVPSGTDVGSDSATESNSGNSDNGDTDGEEDTLDIDIPTLAGGAKYKSVYDADDTTMLYWENVTAEAVAAYESALAEMGYTARESSDNTSIWASVYTKSDVTVHAYYLKRLSELRVLRSDKATLPDVYGGGEKLCEISVTQMGTDPTTPSSGMGYIIQLEDKSFIIIDGGSNLNSDPAALYQKLDEMNGDAEKITVSAWFFTHNDPEHYGALMSYMGAYDEVLDIKMIVANDAPSDVYNELGATSGGLSFSMLDGTFGGAKYVKAHTGQKFSFAGLEMNILYTHEDANALSTTSIHSKNAMVFDAVLGEERIIWLGDIEKDGADRLATMYGEDLNCTVLQVSGGADMGSEALYKKCAPKTVLYHAPKTVADNSASEAKDIYLMQNSERVIYSYNGTLTLSFSGNIDIGDTTGSADENDRYTNDY